MLAKISKYRCANERTHELVNAHIHAILMGEYEGALESYEDAFILMNKQDEYARLSKQCNKRKQVLQNS